ncbi:hypothetical protein EVAR_28678_1 [Eumeta japonica]|uniref:Uncharacterized protein n=1 Tax=Eumeta variegata TaxID=151549 RepID=A0A4C1V3X9_EUMVA|nr:hypothetical protein EVAR_28678_1 [Eumeta japonica]
MKEILKDMLHAARNHPKLKTQEILERKIITKIIKNVEWKTYARYLGVHVDCSLRSAPGGSRDPAVPSCAR